MYTPAAAGQYECWIYFLISSGQLPLLGSTIFLKRIALPVLRCWPTLLGNETLSTLKPIHNWTLFFCIDDDIYQSRISCIWSKLSALRLANQTSSNKDIGTLKQWQLKRSCHGCDIYLVQKLDSRRCSKSGMCVALTQAVILKWLSVEAIE